MKMIIYSYYKQGKKEKRGTYDNGVFIRSRTPLVWDRYIALEPDVIEQLEKLGCVRMEFTLRDEKRKVKVVETTIERFKGSTIKEIGKPDKRPQYLFDVDQAKLKPKDDPRQGDLFKCGTSN
jgi:hypothetical protein